MSVAIFAGQALFAQDSAMPKSTVRTTYDLGSTGYVEATAMADADADEEGWARVRESSSDFSPGSMTVGGSISESDTAGLLGYRYPQLSAYVSEEDVYSLIKAIDETYVLFREGNRVMGRWDIVEAGSSPVVGPFHPGTIKYLIEKGVWDTARQDGMEEIANSTAPRWMSGVAEEALALRRLKDMVAATPVEGCAAATHALASYDQSNVVPTLDCPFLGITGEEDGAMPAAVRKQFAEVPGAQFTDVQGVGHLPKDKSPDAFNTALTAFLEARAPQIFKEIR